METVLAELRQADADAGANGRDGCFADADAMSLTDLTEHIEQTQHAYLRSKLPRLDEMTEKVYRVHGESEPRLAEVRWAFTALKQELESHTTQEEQILFPIIRRMEAAGGPARAPFGSIAHPIGQMELEHEQAGAALAPGQPTPPCVCVRDPSSDTPFCGHLYPLMSVQPNPGAGEAGAYSPRVDSKTSKPAWMRALPARGG